MWDLLREEGPSSEEGIPGRGVQRRHNGCRRRSGGEGLNPLQRYADSLPEGTLVLVVAGSPCQQLTHGGRLRGRQGLCGQQSVQFYAVPVVAWFLAEYRADLRVHIVLESAASMEALFRDAILGT